jgi:hypothetical protein
MAIIHFNELDPVEGRYNITLRMNQTTIVSTHPEDTYKYLPHGVWGKYQRYLFSGYLTLQHSVELYAKGKAPLSTDPSDIARGILIGNLDDGMLDDFDIFPNLNQVEIPKETFFDILNGLGASTKAIGGDAFPDDGILDSVPDTLDFSGIPPFPRTSGFGDTMVIPFPTLAHDISLFYERFGWLSGLIISASIVLPVSRLIAVVVEEKEIRVKDMLKQMGLRDWVFSSSWIITYMLIFTFLSLLEMGTMFVGTIYRESSFSLVYCFFFLFMCSQISFCFLVSTFFNRAKLASIVGPVCMLCLLMPAYVFSFYPPHQFIETKQVRTFLVKKKTGQVARKGRRGMQERQEGKRERRGNYYTSF